MAVVGSGSRWRRGPFPKRPEGVVSLACSEQAVPGGSWDRRVGRGARRCEPWSCSVGPRVPCEGVRGVCLRSAALPRATPRQVPSFETVRRATGSGPALHVPEESSRQSQVRPVTASAPPCGDSWRQVRGQRQLSVGGSGGPGSMPRVRPRGISPARPLARPGWAGQHHPRPARLGRAALSHFEPPHRRRCGCHRLVEEL